METEYRKEVHGHKYGKPFVSHSRSYAPERDLAYMQKRIDNPPSESWQPTITKVVIYEREVTEWQTFREIGA